jgi:hypothetical protein
LTGPGNVTFSRRSLLHGDGWLVLCGNNIENFRWIVLVLVPSVRQSPIQWISGGKGGGAKFLSLMRPEPEVDHLNASSDED